jgi:hypothetical protein
MRKQLKDYYVRCAPYCFKKMSDGRYLGLNREYLPLDRSREDVGGRIDSFAYDNLLEKAHEEIGVAISAQDIESIKHSGDKNMFWLYKDGSAPWSGNKYQISYDKKIQQLPALRWLA